MSIELGNNTTFAAEIQRLIYKLIRDYEACDRMCLAEYGVTAAQGYTLLALPQESSVNMNELSRSMGLANSTMTRMVDTLIHKGLASRRVDDEDRRVVRVGLTAKGQRMRLALEKAQCNLLEEAFSDISDHERTLILRALDQITKAIGKVTKTCCTR